MRYDSKTIILEVLSLTLQASFIRVELNSTQILRITLETQNVVKFNIYTHVLKQQMNGSKSRRDQTAFPLTCNLCQSEGMRHAYLYLSNPSNFPQ
jgi:hypothetical protein